MIPTPEQEAATLDYFKKVLIKYEAELEERAHVTNCIRLMINTIEESIKERNTQTWKKIESTPSLNNHKEELEEGYFERSRDEVENA